MLSALIDRLIDRLTKVGREVDKLLHSRTIS